MPRIPAYRPKQHELDEDEELAVREIRKCYYKNYKIYFFIDERVRTVYVLRVLHMLVNAKPLLLNMRFWFLYQSCTNFVPICKKYRGDIKICIAQTNLKSTEKQVFVGYSSSEEQEAPSVHTGWRNRYRPHDLKRNPLLLWAGRISW